MIGSVVGDKPEPLDDAEKYNAIAFDNYFPRVDEVAGRNKVHYRVSDGQTTPNR